MPTQLEGTTSRLPCNVSSRIGVLDMTSGEHVILWKGVEAQIQCALFNGKPSELTLIPDVSNITKVDLYIRRGGPNGAVLVHKTITLAAVGPTTYADWIAGTDQHFEFELADVDTNQNTPSDGTQRFFFVIEVTTTEKNYVAAFGYGILIDVGLTNLSEPVPSPFQAVYTSAAGRIQNPILDFTGVTVTGLSTNVIIGPDINAIEALTGTGFAVRSGTDTWVQRSIVGTTNEITVVNGDGVVDNPVVSLPSALDFSAKTITGGVYVGPNISKIANFTLNGFVKTISDNGTLDIDTTTYEVPILFGTPLTRISNIVAMPIATASVNGYLTAANFVIFNAKQNQDSDLDQLAALTGTNTIYYRSTGTWSAVSMGTGMSFSGGVLSSSGAAGGPFPENLPLIKGDPDTSKLLFISLANLAMNDNVTLSVPNYDGTIATVTGIEALTNKTVNTILFGGGPGPLTAIGGLGSLAITGTVTFAASFSTQQSLVFLQSGATTLTLPISGTLSTFDGVFSSLTGRPTTIAGYNITDAQMKDDDLTALAALSGTDTIYYRSGPSTWSAVAISSGLLFSSGTLSNLHVIGTTVQAYDADLTSLAAASEVGKIYYRSTSNTWSPVTVGSGLTFIGGSLVATASGGSVTTFASNNLAPIFTTSVATATTTPTLSFNLSLAPANSFLGNNTGSLAAPAYYSVLFTNLSGTIGIAQMADNLVTNAKLDVAPGLTLKGCNKGSPDYVEDLTIAQVKSLLNYIPTDIGAQPVHGNLTSLSNASSVAIYYRAAGNAWTPVVIGANLTFVGDTLSATGGGGGGDGDGDALTSQPLSQFAATTSAQLAGVMTNETGTGVLVFNTSPVLITPFIGAATGISFNGLTITSSAGSTFTLTPGKALTFSNSMTFNGTDDAAHTFPTTSSVLARTDVGQTFNGNNIFAGTSEPVVKVTITGSGGGQILSLFQSALANGSRIFFAIGKSWTLNNAGHIAFRPNATASSNTITVGHYANDDLLNVFASGGITIGAALVDPGASNLHVANNITANGVITAVSSRNTGLNGTGFAEFLTQSLVPAAPPSGYREYADSSGRRAWISTSDGKTRVWDGLLTQNRTYTLQDVTGTVAMLTNKISDFAMTSSTELATKISDKTGTSALVFSNTPTLVTPILGVATATSLNKIVFTTPATAATVTIANNQTFTVNNNIILASDGTGTRTLNIGLGGTLGTLAFAVAGADYIVVSGVPTLGQVPIASSGTAAAWGTLIANATPINGTTSGVAGNFRWDVNYIYVCTVTGTTGWKRAALSTFP